MYTGGSEPAEGALKLHGGVLPRLHLGHRGQDQRRLTVIAAIGSLALLYVVYLGVGRQLSKHSWEIDLMSSRNSNRQLETLTAIKNFNINNNV